MRDHSSIASSGLTRTSETASAPFTSWKTLRETGRWSEFLQQMHSLRTADSVGWSRAEWAIWAQDYASGLREAGQFTAAREWQVWANQWSGIEAADSDPQLLSNTACDQFLLGNSDLAEELWGRALVLELAAENWLGAAADWGNLSFVAAQRGNYRWAKRCLLEALRLHRRSGDPLGTGLDLQHLAQLAYGAGLWGTARKLATRAANVFTDLHHHSHLNRARALWWDAQQALERCALPAEWN